MVGTPRARVNPRRPLLLRLLHLSLPKSRPPCEGRDLRDGAVCSLRRGGSEPPPYPQRGASCSPQGESRGETPLARGLGDVPPVTKKPPRAGGWAHSTPLRRDTPNPQPPRPRYAAGRLWERVGVRASPCYHTPQHPSEEAHTHGLRRWPRCEPAADLGRRGPRLPRGRPPRLHQPLDPRVRRLRRLPRLRPPMARHQRRAPRRPHHRHRRLPRRPAQPPGPRHGRGHRQRPHRRPVHPRHRHGRAAPASGPGGPRRQARLPAGPHAGLPHRPPRPPRRRARHPRRPSRDRARPPARRRPASSHARLPRRSRPPDAPAGRRAGRRRRPQLVHGGAGGLEPRAHCRRGRPCRTLPRPT